MAGDQKFGRQHGLKRRASIEPEGDQHRLTTQLKKLRINHAPIRPYITSPSHQSLPADYMAVDETKDKVIIHDLDAEIAQIEAEEPQTLLIPEIDKKFSALPQVLLKNQAGDTNNQLILYQVPSSISVPKEQDHVRKAIIAARQRAREKQAQEERQAQLKDLLSMDHDDMEENISAPVERDPDAMDLC